MVTVRIICADVLDGLRELADESVQCVVTSPPYWGLRDYGTALWRGGIDSCDHREQREGEGASSVKQNTSAGTQSYQYRGVCRKCGAIRIDRQLGLEATPAEYVERMVGVFREVRRVLRADGTLWLNMGDCYAGNGGQSVQTGPLFKGRARQRENVCMSARAAGDGLKAKDLVGMPWRLAFALQADGWWLRSDIVWNKPNPMPESVTDRPTKAHEYVFLMSKAERYSYDAAAIAENALHAGDRVVGETRNARSVWMIATQPYPQAHFATFPEELPARCIKAGCPEGGTVLDPFGGAGTTGLVAAKLGRNAILIELNPKYAAMAERRIAGEVPLLANVAMQAVHASATGSEGQGG